MISKDDKQAQFRTTEMIWRSTKAFTLEWARLAEQEGWLDGVEPSVQQFGARTWGSEFNTLRSRKLHSLREARMEVGANCVTNCAQRSSETSQLQNSRDCSNLEDSWQFRRETSVLQDCGKLWKIDGRQDIGGRHNDMLRTYTHMRNWWTMKYTLSSTAARRRRDQISMRSYSTAVERGCLPGCGTGQWRCVTDAPEQGRLSLMSRQGHHQEELRKCLMDYNLQMESKPDAVHLKNLANILQKHHTKNSQETRNKICKKNSPKNSQNLTKASRSTRLGGGGYVWKIWRKWSVVDN